MQTQSRATKMVTETTTFLLIVEEEVIECIIGSTLEIDISQL